MGIYVVTHSASKQNWVRKCFFTGFGNEKNIKSFCLYLAGFSFKIFEGTAIVSSES